MGRNFGTIFALIAAVFCVRAVTPVIESSADVIEDVTYAIDQVRIA
jgi:hypothetical protein